MNRNIIITIIVVVIIVIGLIIYGSTRNTSTTNTNTGNQNTPATSTTGTSTATSTAKSFTVTGKDYSFSPNQITVKQGDKVTITFVNQGGFHDFVLDEFNVRTKQFPAGQQEVVTFTANKTGSFQYYCSVDNHRAMGMRGTLIVQP